MKLISAYLEKKRWERIEAETPFALRSLALLLDMNMPFVQALRVCARYGEFGIEISKALAEIDAGSGVQKALANFAERSKSAAVKRGITQIITAYEHGSKGEDVRRVADDLASLQRHKVRDYVSKSSFFGLLFVISAAVVPTFVLMFSTAGKFALGIEIGQEIFLAILLIGLPLVEALILAASFMQMPPDVFRRNWIDNAALAFFVGVVVLTVLMLLGLEPVLKMVALVLVCIGMWLAFRREYLEEIRIERIEDALPDALLSASGLPKNYGVEKVFERMAEGKGAFAEEAARTLRQLKSNVSVEAALSDMRKRGLPMLSRLAELMLEAHLAGANISERMHNMAEDLLRMREITRERENALSTQKYTLFLGALVIPLILGASLGLTKTISAFLDKPNVEVLSAAPAAVSAYIVIYSALSAVYAVLVEGKRSRAVPYFAVMTVLGLVCFYILSQQFGH